MAEIKNAAPDQEFNDDGSKNPDFIAPKKEDEGDDKSKDSDKNKDEDDKGGEVGDKDKDAKDFDDNAEPIIPVRKSVAQHIIARKNEKIKKLESKLDKKDEDDTTTDVDDDDDSDLSDDASKAIKKEVDKRIAPIIQTFVTEADAQELKDLFVSEPEAKKYEKHIKAYMGHEAYKGVSPTVIYHHLAFNNAQAVGAHKKKVADLEAEQHKNGGRGLPAKNTVSDLPTADDIAGMSEEEFEKMEADARQGKYLNK